MDDLSALKELFNTRFDALESRIKEMHAQIEKENQRQDAANIREFNRLNGRLDSHSKKIDRVEALVGHLNHKVKVGWYIGGLLVGGAFTILVAYLQKWFGL